jgi:hypothetical protein
VVCTRVPGEGPSGRCSTHVWTVNATMSAVTELGDHLRCQGIEVVTVESTSDYWRVCYVVLEAAGLKVQLVNARSVKNVPDRAKTDKKDAVWLAKLTERGMLQPSFVPPYDIRRLGRFTAPMVAVGITVIVLAAFSRAVSQGGVSAFGPDTVRRSPQGSTRADTRPTHSGPSPPAGNTPAGKG